MLTRDIFTFIQNHAPNLQPLQAPAMTTVLSRQNPLTLTAALDDFSSASGFLFWDDGITVDDNNDNYSRVDFEVNENTLSSSVVVDNYQLTGLGVERVKVYGVLGLVSYMSREILLPWIKLKESAL